MDPISSARLVGLHEETAKRYTSLDSQFSAWAPEGTFLRLTVGLRNEAQQNAAYAQGRTAPGPIVTNAQYGFSWHNSGFATDLVPIVNGEPDWDVKSDNWQKIFAIAPGCGFFCGINFKSIPGDDDHLQLAELPESPTGDDASLLKSQGVGAVWNKYFPLITEEDLA